MELDDEVRFLHLIRGDDATAARTRRQCVNANARLVVGVARTFEGRGLRLDQLIEAGNEGLLRAGRAVRLAARPQVRAVRRVVDPPVDPTRTDRVDGRICRSE